MKKSVGVPRSYVGEMVNLIAHMEDDKQKLISMYNHPGVYDDIEIDFSGLDKEIDKVYGKLNELLDKVTYEGSDFPNGGRDNSTGIIYRSQTKKGLDSLLQIISQARYDLHGELFSCPPSVKDNLREIIDKMDTLKMDLSDLEYQRNNGWDIGKSVIFKGYKGTWSVLAQNGHYTIWKCNEEPNALNIVTQTKKNSKTGRLVEKIIMETDEFKDAKVQKMFGVVHVNDAENGFTINKR